MGIEIKPSEGSSPPVTAKGHGLKKWRRIQRELSKDGSGNLDTSKTLKRGLSASTTNSVRPEETSIEMRQKSDGSLSSAKAVARNLSASSSLECRWPRGLNFAAGSDSENSEGRSSRSSTAASVPKSRYEIPLSVCNARDKNRMNGFSGKNVVNSVQTGVKGKNSTEAIKMLRGEGVKIEKENSHSSVESDSRSSNFVFVQGACSGTNYGKQSGISTNCKRDSSNSNVGKLEDHAQAQEDLVHGSWEVNGEKVKNHSSSKDIDPLVESIFSLQSAQEALQREIQELRGIGAIAMLDSLNQGSNLRSDSEENAQNSTHFLGKEVIKSLKQNVGRLESKIEEANALLKVKDTEVVELEYAIMRNESAKEESRSAKESRWKEHIEMESELEDLFKQKIEAEIEYLTISRTIPKVSKSKSLKRQAESSRSSYADIIETDQVLKLRKRMCKFTSFFFAQFILLFLVFLVFLLQLSPHYAGVVPT